MACMLGPIIQYLVPEEGARLGPAGRGVEMAFCHLWVLLPGPGLTLWGQGLGHSQESVVLVVLVVGTCEVLTMMNSCLLAW
jgi:hypothetical protein